MWRRRNRPSRMPLLRVLALDRQPQAGLICEVGEVHRRRTDVALQVVGLDGTVFLPEVRKQPVLLPDLGRTLRHDGGRVR